MRFLKYLIVFLLIISAINLSPAGAITQPKIPLGLSDISWSPRGDKIAFSGSDAWLYTIASDTVIQFTTEATTDFAWNPMGTRLATLNFGVLYPTRIIRIWDVDTLALTDTIVDTVGFGNNIDWNPVNNYIALSGTKVTIYDIDTGQVVDILDQGLGEEQYSNFVAWNPDGIQLAAYYIDEYGTRVVIWDTVTENINEIISITDGGLPVVWNEAGTKLAVAENKDVFIWDTHTYQSIARLSNPFTLWQLEWVDSTLVTSFGGLGISVWDTDTNQIIHQIGEGVSDVALSPDARSIAYVIQDGTIAIDSLAHTQNSSKH